jgi:hypothetical protein
MGRIQVTQPGNGYSLNKTAGYNDAPIVDPMQSYNRSVSNDDEIWQALTTEAGRQAIGAQMAVPIRSQLDYVGVSRKFFEIDVLAQGQIARYDKDIDTPAYVVAKRGRVAQFDVEGSYVEPPVWEIFAPAQIRLSEIQIRRFNILDRTQEKIRINMQLQEDDQFLALLASTTAGNTTNNAITNSTTGFDKNFVNNLTSVIMDHDLPCYGLLMKFSSFKGFRGWDQTEVDPVTMREILETGFYGQIWGIDIIVSRRVPAGNVFALAEPRFMGVMPVRIETMLMPDDDPQQATIGYVGYELIGQTVVNANGVAKGTHN